MFEEDALTEESVGGIFPFLSVLICTMGVMVLILVGGSVGSTMKGAGATESLRMKYENLTSRLAARTAALEGLEAQIAAIENASVEAAALAERTLNIQAEIRSTQERAESHAKRVEALRRDIAGIADRALAARQALKRLDAFRSVREAEKARDDARAQKEAASAEIASIGRSIAELERELAALESRRAELAARAESPEAQIAFEDGTEPAVVLDLRADGVTAVISRVASAPAGKTYPAAEIAGELGLFERVASEVAQQGGYALLIVRPGAVATYLEARRAFRKWRANFRHEPAESNWVLRLQGRPGPGG